MPSIQFDVNVAKGVATDIAINTLPVWWMEVNVILSCKRDIQMKPNSQWLCYACIVSHRANSNEPSLIATVMLL